MDSDDLGSFDPTRPLQVALLALNGSTSSKLAKNNFPKPSTLVIATDDETDEDPPTTMEIIDEVAANLDCYPTTIRIMMRRGLIKRKQLCRRCDRPMNLRRRKNCYEWRCRSREKKGDCSSVSIKYGSWFVHTKLSLKNIYNFLIMHIKKCSTGFMAEQLNLSNNVVNEIKRTAHLVTDRIQSRYPKIGKNKKDVLVEVITLKAKKTIGPVFHVLAGQEIGSSQCFAAVLPDLSKSSLTAIKNQFIDPSAKVRMVKTSRTEESVVEGSNPDFFDELTFHKQSKDRLFTNIRQDQSDFVFVRKSVQGWLNDQVVRKMEGVGLLEKFFEELQSYAK
uniref:HTH_Tnp_Tc3_2 domain-containing protein n=1 Tax=Caenorhabditis tropicalis TaxID=1561998 RepID=A0A1I7TZ25_9PELO